MARKYFFDPRFFLNVILNRRHAEKSLNPCFSRLNHLIYLRSPREDAMPKKYFFDWKLFLNVILNRGREDEIYNAVEFWQLLETKQICAYLTDVAQKRIYEDIEAMSGSSVADRVFRSIQSTIQTYRITPGIMEEALKLPVDDYESAIEVVCAKQLGITSLLTHRPEHFRGSGLQLLSLNDVIRYHLNQTTGLSQPISFQFRGTQSLAANETLINLGQNRVGYLLIRKDSATDGEVNIEVRLQGSNSQDFLPDELTLMLLDQDHRIVMEGNSSLSKQGIGLEFSGEPGEPFVVRIVGKGINFAKAFVI